MHVTDMRLIYWKMMNNSVMGNAVSALTIMWKHRYISDDQWEQLYWEFFYCCSLVWKYPIHIVSFIICAPRLAKVLLFFCPLLISTVLLLLIVFSLGPQLERMRADRDLQWQRFREAAVSDEDSGGGSWACEQPYSKLGLPRGVNRKMAKGADDWVEWTQSLEKMDGSIYYTEEHPGLEKDDKNVDYGKATEENVEQEGGGRIVVSSKSLILGKVRELMERLIDELGGSVELDALNALESITQVLIESTGRDYQKQGKYSYPFSMRKTDFDLSDDEQFQKTLYAGNCELVSRQGTVSAERLEHAPRENIEASGDDEKEGKNSSFLAMAEAEYKQSDDLKLHDTGYVGESDIFTKPDTIESQNIVGLDHAPGISEDEEEQGENSIFTSTEDGLIDDGHFQTGHVGNSESTAKPKNQNVMSTCIEQDNAFPVYQNVGTSVPVQDREQKADGLSDFGRSELRTCRSLPVEALKDEFRCIDELWEAHDDFGEKASVIGKERDWKPILSNSYSRDPQEHYQLSCSSVKIPEHKNKQHNLLAEKPRSGPSESITFVKRAQFLASPVMVLGTADMDLLWEKYNDASQGAESARKDPITDLDEDLREIMDSDAEDLREPSQVCCLQALKISKGKMPLRKPNLKKISKALKKLASLQHFRGRKTA